MEENEKANIRKEAIEKDIAEAIRFKNLGYSNTRIAKAMGMDESVIRVIVTNAINSVYGKNNNEKVEI